MKSSEKLLLLLAACIALFVGQLFYQINNTKEYSDLVHVYETKRTFDDFSLSDQDGNEVTKQNLYGKWTLVFLGYLSCPDICPMTMAKLSALLPDLNELSNEPVQVMFVSVDPKRDKTQNIKQYVNYFHPQILGVRAEHTELYPFVTSLGLMYSVPNKDEQEYFVDHSASVILIGPDSKITAIFKPRIELKQTPTIDVDKVKTDFSFIVK